MDSETVFIHHFTNPCCQTWKDRYLKIEEKRNALRKGLKIQNEVIDKLQTDNLTLEKEYKEEKIRADAERQEKSKEAAARVSLEKEIDVLKTEIYSLNHQRESLESKAQDVDSELLLLRTYLSEREVEIEKLKELVEEKKIYADTEREEKCEESANRVSLEKEIDVLKTERHSLHHQREGYESMDQNARCEFLLLQTRLSEKEAEIEKLKELVEEEKVKADAEREEKYKESASRVLLEKEMDVLKNEIHSLHQREALESRDQNADSELLLLQISLSEKEAEIEELKELVETEKVHADAKREEIYKETANRVSLEEEIVVLKSEIHSLQQREGSRSNAQAVDSEVSLLLMHHAEMETEINKLKLLVEEEKVQADAEREEKYKETANRVSLENEICALKSEIHLLQQREGSESSAQVVDNEISLLLKRLAEMEAENNNLKELVEEEKVRTDAERQEKNKELANTLSLAKENDVLKSEILSLHQREDSESKDEDSELLLLRTRHAEMGAEIDNLKKLVEEERIKSDCERKKADAEKAAATKVNQELKVEKRKIDEERKKVLETRALLEKLKSEAVEARSLLVFEREAKKKLELERQKALNEKRCVDVEMTKVEGQKKLAEVYKKKANDEKSRADHLSRQLEEHKQKIQNLQNQVQKNVNERLEEEKQNVIRKRKNADTEMNKAELLKKVAAVNEKKALEEKIDQLQKEISALLSSKSSFEASIVNSNKKLDSKTTELEIMRKHLKLKRKQLKHAEDVAKLERDRKDMLQQKIGSITYEFVQFLQRINVLDDRVSQTAEGRDMSNKNIVYNSCASNLLKELLNKYANQLHISQDNGPAKSNSLAMDFFNPTLLPASEGKSTQCISGIDSKMDPVLKCSERKKLKSAAINSTMASFSDRPLMASQGKDLLAVTTTAKLPEGNTNIEPNVHNLKENSGQTPMKTDGTKRSRKRKSITDAVKSIEHLSSEGQKLQMRLERKLSDLNGMLQNQMDKSLQVKSNLEQYPERAKKRKKESSVGEVAMRLLDGAKNLKDINGICELGGNNRDLACFEEVVEGNFMKLLDLDDAVEEECYRRALEKPHSPFVPVIEFQMSETTGHECQHMGTFTEKAKTVQICSYDVVNMEIDKLKPSGKVIPNDSSLSKNGGVVCVARDVINTRNCVNSNAYEDIASAQDIRGSEKVMGPSDYLTNMSRQYTHRLASDKTPKYCVVFSDHEHEGSILRIYCAVKSCINQCSVTYEMDEAVLASLKMENLSPREKASVVFSVLLNFSETTSEVWNSWPTDFIQLSDSLSRCLQTVLSDAEIWSSFLELCLSGELLTLIEEFLLDRRLLVCSDASTESLPISGFRVNIRLEEKHIVLSRTLASRCQLLPGTLILASICATTDHIGFLCEASFNIFRLHKIDNFLVLDILHVFAHVCGSKYFTIEDYSLTMTVVRSLVTFIERERIKGGHACCLSSSVKVCEGFTSSTKCPFSEDAVSMDVVISLLLEKLQNCFLSGELSHPVEPASLENNAPRMEKCESHPMSCSASCCLNRTASAYDQNISHFTDIISLVELISGNMHWDWTCKQIIPQMLKLLDLCPIGNFFTVIVVFLGKLGRLGVDASGYDDKGVESLRSRLSALQNQTSAKSLDFTTQIVLINALVGIIPVNFEKLVKGGAEIPSIASNPDITNSIRNWYSTLSSEQQSLSLGFLEQAASKVAELCSSQLQT